MLATPSILAVTSLALITVESVVLFAAEAQVALRFFLVIAWLAFSVASAISSLLPGASDDVDVVETWSFSCVLLVVAAQVCGRMYARASRKVDLQPDRLNEVPLILALAVALLAFDAFLFPIVHTSSLSFLVFSRTTFIVVQSLLIYLCSIGLVTAALDVQPTDSSDERRCRARRHNLFVLKLTGFNMVLWVRAILARYLFVVETQDALAGYGSGYAIIVGIYAACTLKYHMFASVLFAQEASQLHVSETGTILPTVPLAVPGQPMYHVMLILGVLVGGGAAAVVSVLTTIHYTTTVPGDSAGQAWRVVPTILYLASVACVLFLAGTHPTSLLRTRLLDPRPNVRTRLIIGAISGVCVSTLGYFVLAISLWSASAWMGVELLARTAEMATMATVYIGASPVHTYDRVVAEPSDAPSHDREKAIGCEGDDTADGEFDATSPVASVDDDIAEPPGSRAPPHRPAIPPHHFLVMPVIVCLQLGFLVLESVEEKMTGSDGGVDVSSSAHSSFLTYWHFTAPAAVGFRFLAMFHFFSIFRIMLQRLFG